jgi:TetR/AcrR family transcriptional repressor of nem operon
MRAFWHGGYVGTSMADLTAATGLEKGSLYKAFGCKEQVFLAALDHYLNRAVSKTERIVRSAESPREALRTILAGISRGCSGADGEAGCFAVNATIEADEAPELAGRRLSAHWAWQRSVFERVIAEGQSARQFRRDLPAGELADTVVRLVVGTAVLSRRGADACAGISDRVFALLDRPRSG